MARRAAFAAVCLLAFAGTASAQSSGSDPSARKAALDARIAQLRGDLASRDRRQAVLTEDISAVTARVRALQDDVAGASSRLGRLESELAVNETRLANLTDLFTVQTRKLGVLRHQQAIAEYRLAERLVDIYESRQPTTLEVVLAASTLTELVDSLD